MLRLFGHYVPVPALALGLGEAVLLTLAFYLVSAPVAAAHLVLVPVPAQVSLSVAMVAIVVMVSVGLYHRDVFLDPRLMAIKAAVALLLLVPAAALAEVLASDVAREGARGSCVIWCLEAGIVWVLSVLLTRSLCLRYADSDVFRRPVVVLGTGLRAGRIADLARRGASRTFKDKGFVHACGDPRIVMGVPLDLDRIEDDHALARYARDVGAREIVVATDERRGMPVLQLLHCKIAGINVIDYLAFWERETRKIELEALQPSWLIFSDGFRQGPVIDAAKRVFDVAVSLALFILVLPVVVMAAAAIWLEDRGPALYRQERIGRDGVPFTLLKFRSMRQDAERLGTPQWAAEGDPRVTRVGAILRMFRIDELPQLLNVLKGDMSFVGPRPERPYFVDELAKGLLFYRERHSVKPGITGWAQVNYPYGASLEDARQKLSYDLYYVKNRTLFLDFLILFETVRVILFQEGAR